LVLEIKSHSDELHWEPRTDGFFELHSATIKGLLGLAMEYDMKPLVPTVLVTHNMYFSSEDLFEKLMKPFQGPTESSEARQQCIQSLYVFKQWFKFNPSDWTPQMRIRMEQELDRLSQGPNAKFGEMLQSWFADMTLNVACSTNERLGRLFTFTLGEQVAPSVLDYGPVEIAHQLTLRCQFLFKHVTVNELLNKRYDNETSSPNLHRLSAHSNWVSTWVSSEILIPNPKKRAKVILFFLQVAKKLLEVRNFADFLSCLIGLQHFSVSRLKAVKTLSGTDLKLWNTFAAIINPSSNFRGLRSLIEAAAPPAVPSFSMILKDLTFIDEGNQTFIDPKATPKYLNLSKIIMTGQIIARIQYLQNTSYPFPPTRYIQKYFNSVKTLESEKRGDMSLVLEPREPKH